MSEVDLAELESDLRDVREGYRRLGVINWEKYKRGEATRHAQGYADASNHVSNDLDRLLEKHFGEGGYDGE